MTENDFLMMAVDVQKRLEAKGRFFSLERVQAVMEAYDDHCEDNAPQLDEDEFYDFVQDKLIFDKSMPPLTKEHLEKLTNIHMEFLASKGLIPEDWNEDE
jgi:hypothetical protein